MGELHLLGQPVMAAPEAARQLGIPVSTLKHWLEGEDRGQRHYPPVLRSELLGHFDMTWGEVVEAQYLRAYRSKVSMQRLRPFLQAMRQEFGVPYPLAHFRPYLDASRNLIVDLQERTNVPDSLLLVVQGRRPGHYLLNRVVEVDFLDRVDFEETAQGLGAALRMFPDGRESPVVLDPELSSGAATVRGIRCEVLAGLVDAGEHVDDVADEFDITSDDVRAACAHEWRLRRPRVA
jgi:uncharacterized protein (DUF433 family)